MKARTHLDEVMRAWREDRRPIEYSDLVALDAAMQCDECAARVATIGRRFHGAEPLPPSAWRKQLRHLAKWMLICLGMVFASWCVLWAALAQAHKPASTCEQLIAQWQPNVPAHIRMKCKAAEA